MDDDGFGFVKVEQLTGAILNAFFAREIPVLMLVNQIEDARRSHIAAKILQSELTGYAVEPSFKKRGAAWFDHQTPEARQAHLERTMIATQDVRDLCFPYAVPTEVLKLNVDLLWKPGAMNLRIGGRPLHAGLPRVLRAGGAVAAHYDWIGRDSPGMRGIKSLKNQFSAVGHLETAEFGGQLVVWNTSKRPDELELLRLKNHQYALDEEQLGPPATIVRPQPGCFILFDASQPHAVREARGARPRVTISCFLGYAGLRIPILFWS